MSDSDKRLCVERTSEMFTRACGASVYSRPGVKSGKCGKLAFKRMKAGARREVSSNCNDC